MNSFTAGNGIQFTYMDSGLPLSADAVGAPYTTVIAIMGVSFNASTSHFSYGFPI